MNKGESMKKLLIFDGDNTLWTGIFANSDKITLPNNRYNQCEDLYNRGVLQSVASHNLLADVETILYVNKLSDFFLYNQADFGKSKSQMVKEIINLYGLTTPRDVVYLDDDPFNRAEVKNMFSEIIVADPKDLQTVIDVHFTKEDYTEEDRLRVRRYRSELQRNQASVAYGADYQKFLQECDLQLTLNLATEEDVPRIIDLISRANRMAALARTYTEEEIARNLQSIIVGKVRDRFGDYGLSVVLIAGKYWMDQVRYVDIDALVISCRLQGRGIGSAVLGAIFNSEPLGTRFEARWQETEYNQGIKALYEWYKFEFDYTHEFQLRATLIMNKIFELPNWVEVVWE